jgi:hypothetical protein
MKLFKNAIILVVVLGLLLTAYLLFKDKIGGSTDNDYTPRDITKIIDVSTMDMVEMTIQNADGAFTFKHELVKQKNEGEEEKEVWKWLLVSPEGFKYDESKVNSVAINFSSLSADKVIEEEAQDLSQYGLNKPPVVITVKLSDGTVKELELGDMTPTKGAYYAKEKDINKVYTVGSYTGDKLIVSKNDLKNKTLFTFTGEDITAMSMKRNGAVVFESHKQGDYDWTLTQPIKGTANASAISPMQEAIAGMSVVEFIEEKPTDLKKYGLENPKYVLEARTQGETVKIFLGNEADGGKNYYAKVSDDEEVFTVSAELLTFLDKPIEEIVEVFAYIVNINTVNRVTVEMDGRTDVLDIKTDEEDKDNDVFKFNGTDVSEVKDEKDSQIIRKYYQALIGITLSKVEPLAEPSGKPEITLTYELKEDPGVMKVEFVPKDEYMYYVKRNGEYTGILVSKGKFDEEEGMRDMYNRLNKAMN